MGLSLDRAGKLGLVSFFFSVAAQEWEDGR